MSDFDLVVLGDVVLSDRVLEGGYVAVRNGIVERVGTSPAPSSKDVHDFSGALVLPGAIDAQVHSKSQKDREDFIWSTRSAAAGGVTMIVDMPYDDGDLICTPAQLTRKADSASAQARVDFGLYGTVHPRDGAKHIDGMVEAGAIGFKFSTFETHPERFPRIPPYLLHDCFSAIAKHGLIAGVHNENDEAVRYYLNKVKAEGLRGYSAHGLSRPPITETLAIAEVYEIAADTGCSGHIVHCSLGRGYDLCASYRQQGFDTTIEACIHYLTLNEDDDVSRLAGLAKVNPPIRSRTEMETLWRHLAAGNITIVSTDHVSWSMERKTHNDMLENASGIASLELLYLLLLKGLKERDLPVSWAARLLAANPARLFRIGHRKGALEPGRDADITVVKKETYKYDPTTSGNNIADWSPFENLKLPYRVQATYLRGEPVFDGTNVLAEPGTGQFIRPITGA